MSDFNISFADEVSAIHFQNQSSYDESPIETLQRQMRQMQSEIASLRATIRSLTMSPPIAGTFPPFDEIQHLCVQVFHTDPAKLTSKKKMAGHTEWSLRVECTWQSKVLPGIDIALRPKYPFGNQVREYSTNDIVDLVAKMPSDIHGGIIRVKGGIKGVSRSYLKDQIATIRGIDRDDPTQIEAMFILGDTKFFVDRFTRAKGSSLYVAHWNPKSGQAL